MEHRLLIKPVQMVNGLMNKYDDPTYASTMMYNWERRLVEQTVLMYNRYRWSMGDSGTCYETESVM